MKVDVPVIVSKQITKLRIRVPKWTITADSSSPDKEPLDPIFEIDIESGQIIGWNSNVPRIIVIDPSLCGEYGLYNGNTEVFRFEDCYPPTFLPHGQSDQYTEFATPKILLAISKEGKIWDFNRYFTAEHVQACINNYLIDA